MKKTTDSTDVMTPEQRKLCMSRIRSKNTGPEMKLRKALWMTGYRYRITYPLPGKPDLVFIGARLAVFVDGCFWHQCPIHSTRPKANENFWRQKLERNIERDRQVQEQLDSLGWRAIRFWEHEIDDTIDTVIEKIRFELGQMS